MPAARRLRWPMGSKVRGAGSTCGSRKAFVPPCSLASPPRRWRRVTPARPGAARASRGERWRY